MHVSSCVAIARRPWWGIGLWIAALNGCGDAPAPAPPPDATSRTPIAGPDTAEPDRRHRFEARPTVETPATLPPAWKRLISNWDGRLTAVEHGERTRVGRQAIDRRVRLQVRVFGRDDEIRTRLMTGLRRLDLPGLGDSLPDAEIRRGDVTWSIEVFSLIAPRGSAREHRVELRWARHPSQAAQRPKCRKPPPLDQPALAPAWLRTWARNGATRRIVGVDTQRTAKKLTIEMTMLYRNGLSHDEAVGKLARAAGAAGFEPKARSGPRQRWRHPNGQTLELSPNREELRLGCVVSGPVLQVRWSGR